MSDRKSQKEPAHASHDATQPPEAGNQSAGRPNDGRMSGREGGRDMDKMSPGTPSASFAVQIPDKTRPTADQHFPIRIRLKKQRFPVMINN
jgi:hypothetical protein